MVLQAPSKDELGYNSIKSTIWGFYNSFNKNAIHVIWAITIELYREICASWHLSRICMQGHTKPSGVSNYVSQ